MTGGWQTPWQTEPALDAHTAHVWRVVLPAARLGGAPAEDAHGPFACLSTGERERRRGFIDAAAGDVFAWSRVALRHILSLYTGAAPDSLDVHVETGGRPRLLLHEDVRFSLSHTSLTTPTDADAHQARAVTAIAVAAADVGVDVERSREPRRVLRVAERVLHPATVRLLASVHGAARATRFVAAWTQREAHVKAVGGGMFMTPDVLPLLDVPPDGRPHVVTERGGDAAWSIARFVPEPDTHGCVVVRGTLERVLFFDWNLPTEDRR